MTFMFGNIPWHKERNGDDSSARITHFAKSNFTTLII